jgi:hypothetical protein
MKRSKFTESQIVASVLRAEAESSSTSQTAIACAVAPASGGARTAEPDLRRILCCTFAPSSTVIVSPSETPTTRPSTVQEAARAGAQ